jgi:hypothetical protein
LSVAIPGQIAILDIMSSNERGVQMKSAVGSDSRRVVAWLLALAALQTLLTIGHFVYGAHLYEDPSREHVVLPAIVFLVIAAVLGGAYRWKPSRWALWLLGAEVAVVDVGLFGFFHGGFNHVLKDLFYVFGTDPGRLAQIFDSPDFAIPDDALFEATGIAGLLVALGIAFLIVRLIRAAHRRQEVASCA